MRFQPDGRSQNASVAEVAEKVREARGSDEYLRPGKWLSKATLEELSAPGMPAGMADQMKLTMASKPGSESCMTEDDVQEPNTDFFGGKNDQCRYDHFKMGDGKIDAQDALHRRRRHAADDDDRRLWPRRISHGDDHEHGMPEPAAAAAHGSMTMKMRVEGKRIGDCDAGEAAKS